jgi:hypothetical protein
VVAKCRIYRRWTKVLLQQVVGNDLTTSMRRIYFQ